MIEEKLRIGLLIDDFKIPRWAYDMLNDILDTNQIEISLVIKKETFGVKKKIKLSEQLFYLYSKFEDKLFKVSPNASESKNIRNLVTCDELIVRPEIQGNNDCITNKDVNIITDFELDIIIKLGFQNLKGSIYNCSKYGIWSFCFSNATLSRGGPVGVWEVLDGKDEIGVSLQILKDNFNDSFNIFESYSCSDYLSINRNKNAVLWKAKTILPRKLLELKNSGSESFFKKVNKREITSKFLHPDKERIPKNFELIIKLTANYLRSIKEKISSLFYFGQWALLYKIEKSHQISKSFHEFTRILPPKDRIWTDPFVLERENKYYLFIEEMIYKQAKGKISVIEIDQKGEYKKPQVILETDYHLSYPFLIEEGEELYMIPETSENKTIELYKCIQFPYKWGLETILMKNVKANDSTIFKHNNKYWLFTNIKTTKGVSVNDELFLYYSDSLLSANWTAHPNNPIVSDVKSARSAGKIYKEDNRIFRPAQNSSKFYGYGMKINEILILNETEYLEKEVQSIYPDWDKDLICTHTLNHSRNLTVIDARIKRRKKWF